MRIFFGLLIGCWLIEAHGQEAPKNSDWAMQQPYVVMISIDGFRYDYAEKFNAPNLLKIKALGSSAKSMTPGFPSKTFPNHYSLVTGLYPNSHGVVGNSFYSRERKEFFTLGNPTKVQDANWYGGKPIWTLAEQNGMVSASYFWAGSEAPIEGFRPTYWKSYDHNVPHEDRIKQVIDWMSLPLEERPHLVTLYFSMVDDAGHAFGPDAAETKEAVLAVDHLIGELREALRKMDLPVYLLVTSDHGMTAVSRSVSLHDVNAKDAVVDISSTMVMYYHDDPKVIKFIARQLKKKELLQIYTRAEMGEKFGFDHLDRVGDLVALSEPPVQILKSPSAVRGGTHGFDAKKFKEMGSFFLIEGEGVKSAYVLEPFDNVHVYPLLAKILGLPIPADIDGKAHVLEEIWEKQD